MAAPRFRTNSASVLRRGKTFQSPIPTQIVSNEEFTPIGQTRDQARVEQAVVALVADGKPDSLIIFTSSADDAFGNDIRSDGALTTPAAGHWYGISFSGISNDVVTVIDNVRLRYCGGGGS